MVEVKVEVVEVVEAGYPGSNYLMRSGWLY